MNMDLTKEITFIDIVYAITIVSTGLIIAIVFFFIFRRIQQNLKANNQSQLAAVIKDFEKMVIISSIFISIYMALLSIEVIRSSLSQFNQVFTILLIALISYTLEKSKRHLLEWYSIKINYNNSPQIKTLKTLIPTVQWFSTLVIISLSLLICLDIIGISIAPLIAGLGIGGLAVALALQGTLSNFFAGVNVLTDGNIQVGDYIELADGYGGYVSTIGWRSTRIRTLSDNTVTIPNGRLADTIVTNYNHPTDEMSVFIKMGVGYFENLDNVENVVIEVATQVIETTEGAVSQHAPTVWYEEFGDDNVNIYAVMRAKGYIDSWRVKHSFIKAISTRFRTENIEISFHNTNIFMRDES